MFLRTHMFKRNLVSIHSQRSFVLCCKMKDWNWIIISHKINFQVTSPSRSDTYCTYHISISFILGTSGSTLPAPACRLALSKTPWKPEIYRGSIHHESIMTFLMCVFIILLFRKQLRFGTNLFRIAVFWQKLKTIVPRLIQATISWRKRGGDMSG